jgi:hypothetical protein
MVLRWLAGWLVYSLPILVVLAGYDYKIRANLCVELEPLLDPTAKDVSYLVHPP